MYSYSSPNQQVEENHDYDSNLSLTMRSVREHAAFPDYTLYRFNFASPQCLFELAVGHDWYLMDDDQILDQEVDMGIEFSGSFSVYLYDASKYLHRESSHNLSMSLFTRVKGTSQDRILNNNGCTWANDQKVLLSTMVINDLYPNRYPSGTVFRGRNIECMIQNEMVYVRKTTFSQNSKTFAVAEPIS